jgi:hypothetical protein
MASSSSTKAMRALRRRRSKRPIWHRRCDARSMRVVGGATGCAGSASRVGRTCDRTGRHRVVMCRVRLRNVMASRSLPDRFDATPLRSSETTFARRATDVRKSEIDEDAADRADGMVVEHAMKAISVTPKDVADKLKIDESAIYQWWRGKARAPIGRLCVHFPRFEFSYLQTRAAQSEHVEAALTIRDRRLA